MSEKPELSMWLEEQRHLPEVLRDFSNQKEVFAIIERIFARHLPADVNRRDAHIYVVDFFLHFMATRGYTLQKTRTRIDFKDLAKDLEFWREYKMAIF